MTPNDGGVGGGVTGETPTDARSDGSLHGTDLHGISADWAGLRVLVVGLDEAGFTGADALLELGAQVVVWDELDGQAEQERAAILRTLGAEVALGPEAQSTGLDAAMRLAWPSRTISAGPLSLPDLVLAGRDLPLTHPVLAAAATAGLVVWSELELAWRLRDLSGPGAPAPWLVITGEPGVEETARMVVAMLAAGGRRAVVAGHSQLPVVQALRHPQRYEVLVVQASATQLYRTDSLRPLAAAALHGEPTPETWDGTPQEYRAALARVYSNTEIACVYNVQDQTTERMVEQADVIEGARAIGFTLGVPAMSMVGLVDDVLADRAFVAERRTSAAELATLDDVAVAFGIDAGAGSHTGDGDSAGGGASVGEAAGEPVPQQVAHALAAAAFARACGTGVVAVREGLRRLAQS